MRKIKTKVLNYRVIIEPDERTGTNEPGFSAYCPTLDVADGGDTIEEALKNIKEGMECRIEALIKDNEPVPEEDDVAHTIVLSTQVEVPKDYPFAMT